MEGPEIAPRTLLTREPDTWLDSELPQAIFFLTAFLSSFQRYQYRLRPLTRSRVNPFCLLFSVTASLLVDYLIRAPLNNLHGVNV